MGYTTANDNVINSVYISVLEGGSADPSKYKYCKLLNVISIAYLHILTVHNFGSKFNYYNYYIHEKTCKKFARKLSFFYHVHE